MWERKEEGRVRSRTRKGIERSGHAAVRIYRTAEGGVLHVVFWVEESKMVKRFVRRRNTVGRLLKLSDALPTDPSCLCV